jgi:phosphopantothenoylcysteine decarboxylase / phosphopantothenate---cysteine ligase
VLKGKKIILAVTGSISAYKSLFLLRLLMKEGADVRVVMSHGALEFIQPLSFATLSKNPVVTDFTASKEEGTWNNHVDLALWADLILIAPATAHTLSKLAHGTCDSLLLAVLMSARCQIMVAPAMDHDMMLHGGTQDNLAQLQNQGVRIVSPNHGELASGLIGEGRLAEPEELVNEVLAFFHPQQDLKGKKALVNAGPTHEPIDPVRFIGNRSSGKMGIAIAEALKARGAEVTLILGPTSEMPPAHLNVVRVNTAKEMYEECTVRFATCDVAVLSAAVADFRVAKQAEDKIKKEGNTLTLHLETTEDIAASLGAAKKANQILVCFALETANEEANALSKLKRKNADLLVLNSLRTPGVNFGADKNEVTIFSAHSTEAVHIPLSNKSKVAERLVQGIIEIWK